MIVRNKLDRSTVDLKELPIKVIQFGEGNFLRAFADWMIHQMNEKSAFDAGVAVVQPIEKGLIEMLQDQDGLYTVLLNGIKNGEASSDTYLIDCIQKAIDPYKNYEDYLSLAEIESVRFIISNTTEAGISYQADAYSDTPPKSFPGKLTALLKRRYDAVAGDLDKGFYIIPCELIENNGVKLKELVLRLTKEWELGDDFEQWVHTACTFCNTLVDRIVPGYPKNKIGEITERLGYQDQLVVEGEQFGLWVIQGDDNLPKELPAEQANLDVVFASDITPYRTRKVRILNGAHTAMVPVAYLAGIEYVREATEDEEIGGFIHSAIFEEIVPTIDLAQEELESFANEVIARFRNPYLKHALLSISLNSISKFKTRVLPTVKDYVDAKGELPKRLIYAFASLLVFYKGEFNGQSISLKDSEQVLKFARETWSAESSMEDKMHVWLSNGDFWGEDLTTIAGLETLMVHYTNLIHKDGISPKNHIA